MMNTMPYPGTPIPTVRPRWRRWAEDLALAWASYRSARAARRRMRALEGLSEHTLHDIGMAGCMGLRPRSRSLAAADFLRGL
jgi:uncharacterized protein YjiS (DUF1127 family)